MKTKHLGRADYEERRNARIDRYRARADKARTESNATHADARQMASAIPFGQPILVGHHSEKRDRCYRDRLHNKVGKAFELEDKAKHYDRRADATEGSRAISSDDPEALGKLRDKCQALEAKQQRMKAINAAWRRAKKPAHDDGEAWQRIADTLGIEHAHVVLARKGLEREQGWQGAAPFAAYELSNNNAEIRRLKARIAQLEREGTVRETSEIDHGICKVIENVEVNRIQLVFAGKPPEEIRTTLKRNGFRWARYEGAWQRLLNDAGRHAAKSVVAQLATNEHL